MKKISKKSAVMLILTIALSFLMLSTSVVNADIALAPSEIKFVQAGSEDENFIPQDFTTMQYIAGKKDEFENQIEDLKAADLEQYNTEKGIFDEQEAAKVEEDPEYVPQEYPEYVDPVVNDYENLFAMSGNYCYAQIVSSTPSSETIDGVYKTTITVNYKMVLVTEVSNNKTKINSVNLTISAPKPGTGVTKTMAHNDEYNYDYPIYTPEPTITLESGANYQVSGTYYITAYPSEMETGYDEPFLGTFEEGKEYYVEVFLTPKEGYEFANGATLTANGTTGYELSAWNFENQFMFYAKVKAASEALVSSNNLPEDEAVGKVLNGYDQTVNPEVGDVLSFRFDIPYADFLANGKVYIDGQLVDSSKYTAKEGSTIITFNNDYAKTIAVGAHTVKLATAGEEITAKFTVASTPSAGGNAGAPVSPAVESASTISTSNPKTGDNIAYFVIIFASAVAGSVIAVKKYRK